MRATIGHALVAWLVAAPLLIAALYFATLPVLRSFSRRMASARLERPPERV
jgi:hypothetical protein